MSAGLKVCGRAGRAPPTSHTGPPSLAPKRRPPASLPPCAVPQGIVGSVPYASLIFLTLYFQVRLSDCPAQPLCLPACRHSQPRQPPRTRVPGVPPLLAPLPPRNAPPLPCPALPTLPLAQLMGMTNSAASVMVALYLLCGGLGGLLGGLIGDKVAARWPDHGRIVATQFSVIVGVPFALLIFKVGVCEGSEGWVCLPACCVQAKRGGGVLGSAPCAGAACARAMLALLVPCTAAARICPCLRPCLHRCTARRCP